MSLYTKLIGRVPIILQVVADICIEPNEMFAWFSVKAALLIHADFSWTEHQPDTECASTSESSTRWQTEKKQKPVCKSVSKSSTRWQTRVKLIQNS